MRNLFCAFLCISGIFISAETASVAWGAKGAETDAYLTIDSMVQYAIEDEYLAHAEYESILKKFGSVKPFSNIIRAELTHIGWLVDAYKFAKLPVPPDEAEKYIVIPASLDEAFKAGVQAEIDNIAMYDSFIASPLIIKSENKYYRDLFTRLRDASKNHLEAFKKGLQ